jgi:hypothetical protein
MNSFDLHPPLVVTSTQGGPGLDPEVDIAFLSEHDVAIHVQLETYRLPGSDRKENTLPILSVEEKS